MKLNVNGIDHEITAPLLTPLLHVLREELGITSPKAGCLQGGCGACTVLVDGEPRRACLMPVAAVNGAERHDARGHRHAGAAGARSSRPSSTTTACSAASARRASCSRRTRTSSAAAATTRRRSPKSLAGHVCRCTGYVKIVNAVGAAVRGESFDLTMTTGTPTTTS